MPTPLTVAAVACLESASLVALLVRRLRGITALGRSQCKAVRGHVMSGEQRQSWRASLRLQQLAAWVQVVAVVGAVAVLVVVAMTVAGRLVVLRTALVQHRRLLHRPQQHRRRRLPWCREAEGCPRDHHCRRHDMSRLIPAPIGITTSSIIITCAVASPTCTPVPILLEEGHRRWIKGSTKWRMSSTSCSRPLQLWPQLQQRAQGRRHRPHRHLVVVQLMVR